MTEKNAVDAAAERVVLLEAELEAAGNAHVTAEELAWSREILRRWTETVVGVVCSPGVGRVTLIHADGSQSKIASPELPFLLSRPVSFSQRGDED